jgi:hypothetical protein
MMPRVQILMGAPVSPIRIVRDMRHVTAAAIGSIIAFASVSVPCATPSNTNLSRAKYADLTTTIGRTLKDH